MVKIFVASLHRTGTQSTDDLLKNAGFKTLHWPAIWDGEDLQRKIIGQETNYDFVVNCLEPAIAANDALSDVPICAVYESLAKRYNHSVFIALKRPAADWIRSVRRHINGRSFDPFEQTLYWRYVRGKPKSISEIGDEQLYSMHEAHYDQMRIFFSASDNFFEADLYDKLVGEKICSFLGVAPQALPNTDYIRGIVPS